MMEAHFGIKGQISDIEKCFVYAINCFGLVGVGYLQDITFVAIDEVVGKAFQHKALLMSKTNDTKAKIITP